MRPNFLPRLINAPFEDPGLFIPFQFENRAILFDLGDLQALTPRDILKISEIYISHTHMDHFVGFDRLLRLFLGREKILHLFGPPGFLKNAEGKLAGYTWNLVEKYNYKLCLQLTEVRPDGLVTKKYRCRDKFVGIDKAIEDPFNGRLHREPGFSVSAVFLDHGIPCLGFSLQEHFHVNIIREGLNALGLKPGPWLTHFKQALYNDVDPNSEFMVKLKSGNELKSFNLGELARQIAQITPGQKITYITDTVYSDANAEKIVQFASGSDHLFIEAAFLENDRRLAREKYHLTARQAGELAARACVRQFTVFHFSARYTGQENLLYREASEAYKHLADS